MNVDISGLGCILCTLSMYIKNIGNSAQYVEDYICKISFYSFKLKKGDREGM